MNNDASFDAQTKEFATLIDQMSDEQRGWMLNAVRACAMLDAIEGVIEELGRPRRVQQRRAQLDQHIAHLEARGRSRMRKAKPGIRGAAGVPSKSIARRP